MKSILVLGAGHPFACDDGLGCHVIKKLMEMDLPENVECLDCGYSASEFDWVIDGKDHLIFVDAFRSQKGPGTVIRSHPNDIDLVVDGITDVPKLHLMVLLNDILASGKCPEPVFIGVVPKEINKSTDELTPEVAAKVPEVIDLILKEINMINQE